MSDNFKCIYKILRALEAAMDYPMIELDEIGYERLEITKEGGLNILK